MHELTSSHWLILPLFLCASACSDGSGTRDRVDTETESDSDADTSTATGSESNSTDADSDTDPDDSASETGDACGDGIAARYPQDIGIEADTDVIFADDFEGYGDASALSTLWNDGVYHNVEIVSAPSPVFVGEKALRFHVPQQDAELSNTVAALLPEEEDMVYLRFYSRFDASFDVVGSSHNGGGMSAHYYVNGQATPGVPADGTNKFLASMEWWRGTEEEPSPGSLNVYVYHPEQRIEYGDHFFPDGTVLPWTYLPGDFGPDFIARENQVPDVDRWYCHELMVKANTPGERDGRISMWVDGELVADFGNLRLRDVDTLKINRVSLSLHIGSNTRSETWKWFDNVVVARAYIGPVCNP